MTIQRKESNLPSTRGKSLLESVFTGVTNFINGVVETFTGRGAKKTKTLRVEQLIHREGIKKIAQELEVLKNEVFEQKDDIKGVIDALKEINKFNKETIGPLNKIQEIKEALKDITNTKNIKKLIEKFNDTEKVYKELDEKTQSSFYQIKIDTDKLLFKLNKLESITNISKTNFNNTIKDLKNLLDELESSIVSDIEIKNTEISTIKSEIQIYNQKMSELVAKLKEEKEERKNDFLRVRKLNLSIAFFIIAIIIIEIVFRLNLIKF